MNILLIEDDLDLADFIIKAMHIAEYEIEHTDNGAKGLELAVKNQYDVIVVDRILPKMNGIEIIQRLRKKRVSTPVLILSTMSETQQKIDGLQAGSDDYLTKPFSLEELLARVSALARRQTINQENVSILILEDLVLNRLNREVRRDNKIIDLNFKEFKLLEYLMEHADQFITRTMLLQDVWDYDFNPQTNVVDVHISRLRRKIDKGFSQPLLHTKRGVGYMLSKSSLI